MRPETSFRSFSRHLPQVPSLGTQDDGPPWLWRLASHLSPSCSSAAARGLNVPCSFLPCLAFALSPPSVSYSFLRPQLSSHLLCAAPSDLPSHVCSPGILVLISRLCDVQTLHEHWAWGRGGDWCCRHIALNHTSILWFAEEPGTSAGAMRGEQCMPFPPSLHLKQGKSLTVWKRVWFSSWMSLKSRNPKISQLNAALSQPSSVQERRNGPTELAQRHENRKVFGRFMLTLTWVPLHLLLALDPNSVRPGTRLFGTARAALSSLVYIFASHASLCPLWGWRSQLLSFLVPRCSAWRPVRIWNVCWQALSLPLCLGTRYSLAWRSLLLQKVEGIEVNFCILFKCPEVPGAPFPFCRGFADHSWKTWTFQTLLTSFSKFVVVQWPSHVRRFVTPWTVHTRPPCPSLSPSLPKFMFIASMMPSSHLILWCPLLLLPSVFPSIRDFSDASAVYISKFRCF